MAAQAGFDPTLALSRAVRRNFKYWQNIEISKNELENVRRLVVLGFERDNTQKLALELVINAYPMIERFGDLNAWIKTLERALYKVRLDKAKASRLMNLSGLLNWKMGEFEAAKGFHEGAITLSRSSKQLLAESQYGVAQCLWALGDHPQAKEYCAGALRYFESQDRMSRSKAAARNLIGMIHFSQGKFRQAVSDFYLAYLNFRKANDVLGMARSMNNRAMNKAQMSEHRQATRFYYRAAKYFSLIDDDLGVCQVMTSLGILYYQLGRWGKAKEVFQRAIPSEWEVPGVRRHRGWLSLVQGYLNLSQGDLQNAKALFVESCTFWRTVGNERILSYAEAGLEESKQSNSLT